MAGGTITGGVGIGGHSGSGHALALSSEANSSKVASWEEESWEEPDPSEFSLVEGPLALSDIAQEAAEAAPPQRDRARTQRPLSETVLPSRAEVPLPLPASLPVRQVSMVEALEKPRQPQPSPSPLAMSIPKLPMPLPTELPTELPTVAASPVVADPERSPLPPMPVSVHPAPVVRSPVPTFSPAPPPLDADFLASLGLPALDIAFDVPSEETTPVRTVSPEPAWTPPVPAASPTAGKATAAEKPLAPPAWVPPTPAAWVPPAPRVATAPVLEATVSGPDTPANSELDALFSTDLFSSDLFPGESFVSHASPEPDKADGQRMARVTTEEDPMAPPPEARFDSAVVQELLKGPGLEEGASRAGSGEFELEPAMFPSFSRAAVAENPLPSADAQRREAGASPAELNSRTASVASADQQGAGVLPTSIGEEYELDASQVFAGGVPIRLVGLSNAELEHQDEGLVEGDIARINPAAARSVRTTGVDGRRFDTELEPVLALSNPTPVQVLSVAGEASRVAPPVPASRPGAPPLAPPQTLELSASRPPVAPPRGELPPPVDAGRSALTLVELQQMAREALVRRQQAAQVRSETEGASSGSRRSIRETGTRVMAGLRQLGKPRIVSGAKEKKLPADRWKQVRGLLVGLSLLVAGGAVGHHIGWEAGRLKATSELRASPQASREKIPPAASVTSPAPEVKVPLPAVVVPVAPQPVATASTLPEVSASTATASGVTAGDSLIPQAQKGVGQSPGASRSLGASQIQGASQSQGASPAAETGSATVRLSPAEEVVAKRVFSSLPPFDPRSAGIGPKGTVKRSLEQTRELRQLMESFINLGKEAARNLEHNQSEQAFRKALQLATVLQDHRQREWLRRQIGRGYLLRGEQLMKDVPVAPADCRTAKQLFEEALMLGFNGERNTQNLQNAELCKSIKPKGK